MQYKDLEVYSEGWRGETGAGEWWEGLAATRRIRAPRECLRWGNKGTHRGVHSRSTRLSQVTGDWEMWR